MRIELRCSYKKFGELLDGVVEVKCSSRFCGAGPGVMILHQFDLKTGELLKTERFREPERL